MCVITISRGSFSGGKLLAEHLARQLGYRCVDRDVVVDRAAMCGISHDVLRDALDKAPTFLERFRHTRYVYLTLIRAALAEELREGGVVYHGNAGHLLLRGVDQVLRVRIIAPMEFRLGMAETRLGLGRGDALAYIRKVDDERRRWTRCLYGVDWTDASLYDVVLNLEQMSIAEASTSIATLLTRNCFRFTAGCEAGMRDLVLSSRVQATLALDPATAHLELEVTARNGAIRIGGKLTDIEETTEVDRIVLAVPGVTALNKEDLLLPVYV